MHQKPIIHVNGGFVKSLLIASQEVCAVLFSASLIMWAWHDSLDLGFDIKGLLNLTPHITKKARFTR